MWWVVVGGASSSAAERTGQAGRQIKELEAYADRLGRWGCTADSFWLQALWVDVMGKQKAGEQDAVVFSTDSDPLSSSAPQAEAGAAALPAAGAMG